VREDDEVDLGGLISDESVSIQVAVSAAAEQVGLEIGDASNWQRPDYALQVLVDKLVYEQGISKLTVTLFTAGGLVVGRLTNPVEWHQVVKGPGDQDPGPYLGLDPSLADELSRLLDASGMHTSYRDVALGKITRYFLLDATILPIGVDRSACPPPRPWIVQARHVIGWTLGDAATITPPATG
jgi:hypothetical protein